MVKDFHKTVDEFKSQNGNISFTQKDMMIYMLNKIDTMDGKISNTFITKKSFTKMYAALWTAMGGLLYLILQLTVL